MSALKAVIYAVARAGADVVIAIVAVIALLLSPFRVGRLLRAVSIPHFRQHRLRTSLSIFGVALGVAVLVAVVLVNRSINGSFAETINSISGKADLQISGANVGFDEGVMDAVRETANVWKVAPIVQEIIPMRQPGAEGDRMLVLGVDLLGKDDEFFRDYNSNELPAIKENPIGFLNSTSNIIISNKVAKKYGYQIQDKIPLGTPSGTKEFTIWGFVDEEGVGRTFGGSMGIMYYQSAQAIFEKGTRIDRLDIAVKPGTEISEAERALAAQLGAGFEVGRPEKRNERVNKMLEGLQNGLTMGSFLALMVGAFLIYNTMSISVTQRKRELGILRALGTTRSGTLNMVAIEGLLLGIVGSLFGIGLGILMGRGMLKGVAASINETYLQVAANKLHIDAKTLIAAFVLGTIVSFGSSYVPARAAVNANPLDVIKSRNISLARTRFNRVYLSDIFAALFIVLSIVLLNVPPQNGVPVGAFGATLTICMAGANLAPRLLPLFQAAMRKLMSALFGVEGVIANENLTRDLSRTSIITAALMFGVAMTVAFATFVGSLKSSVLDWINQTIPADLWITAASKNPWAKSVPMNEEMLGKFLAIRGVQEVERVRMLDIDYQGDPLKLVGADVEIALRRGKQLFLQGSAETALPALLAGDILISENLARRKHLNAGDEMVLATPTGSKPFKITGVIVDYTWDRGTIEMDRSTLVKHWGDAKVNIYQLFLEPGADLETVRSQITSQYGEAHNLFVQSNAEVKENVTGVVDQTFSIMRALEAVAMMIAILGIINALLASVLDRVREIGVLRAVGMRARKVQKMIVAEAGLIGLISTILGLIVGLIFGWVILHYINITQNGWYFPFRAPIGNLIQTVIVVTIISAFAGYYPARQATKLKVNEALEYE